MTLKNTTMPITSVTNNKFVQFSNSAYTITEIFVSSAADSVVRKIAVNSTDTTSRVLSFYAHDGLNDFLVGNISIPAFSGTDGITPAVELLSNSVLTNAFPIDIQGNKFIALSAGWKLKAFVTQPASEKLITVFVQGADYTVLS